jgi:hypothetical protein
MTPEQFAGADFSECGKYRYKLWRIWDENKPLAMMPRNGRDPNNPKLFIYKSEEYEQFINRPSGK